MCSDQNQIRFFLSYSWKDSDLADRFDKQLSALGFKVKRDIRDIGAWKSIREFMSSIREQDYVVIIISPHYLKSPNCMFEVMEVLKDSNYKDKIFSIVTEDADIYSPKSKAKYISYWEKETEELENAIKSLRIKNTIELAKELRRYKATEITIATFLDYLSDINNPQIMNTIEKIKELVYSTDKQKENISINLNACHYSLLKYVVDGYISETELDEKVLGKIIGIRELKNLKEQENYDLPMLRCEITNNSDKLRTIDSPVINGSIHLNFRDVDYIYFFNIPLEERQLEKGEKAVFSLHGKVMISIIRSLLEKKITSISVKDNFGISYSVSQEQIYEVTNYFNMFCSDLSELSNRFDAYDH